MFRASTAVPVAAEIRLSPRCGARAGRETPRASHGRVRAWPDAAAISAAISAAVSAGAKLEHVYSAGAGAGTSAEISIQPWLFVIARIAIVMVIGVLVIHYADVIV